MPTRARTCLSVALALFFLMAFVGAPRAEDGLLRVHLLWTNDIHGHVAPEPARFMNPEFPPPLGGGASAARYIQKLRAEVLKDPDQDVLLVDAGDTWQGAPVGTITEGRVMETYFDCSR